MIAAFLCGLLYGALILDNVERYTQKRRLERILEGVDLDRLMKLNRLESWDRESTEKRLPCDDDCRDQHGCCMPPYNCPDMEQVGTTDQDRAGYWSKESTEA